MDSVLDRATEAAVPELKPLLIELPSLADRQRLLKSATWWSNMAQHSDNFPLGYIHY